MAERTNAYAEDETLSSYTENNTSAPGTTKLTLTHTPGDNERWWYFANMVVGRNSTAADILTRLYHETAAAEFGAINTELQDTTNKLNIMWGKEHTYGAAPGSQDIKLQSWAEATGTAHTTQYAHIWGLLCEAEDFSAASDGTTSTTSATFTTKVSLTQNFSGNYLFLCFCEFGRATGTDVPMIVRADHGGTKYGTMRQAGPDSVTWRTWSTAFVKEGMDGSSQTISIEFNNPTANVNNVSVRNARIFALCLDNFANYDFVENRTRGNNTTTTPEDQSSLTFSPLATRDHIAFAAVIGDQQTAGVNGFLEFERDGTAICQQEEEPNIAAENYPLFSFRRESLSGSPVFKTQKWTESGGDAGAAESIILVLDLDGAISDVDETGLETGETGETGDGTVGDSIFKSRIFHSLILNGHGVFR